MRNLLQKQRGAVTLLGVAVVVLSLFGFQQVFEFSNAKILDRELDNYARTLAGVALRSELSLTKAGMDDGSMASNQTDTTINSILSEVNLYTHDSSANSLNLFKKITFGNFDANGDFQALEGAYASNPRASGDEPPIEFSAVAVQLWSSDSFYGYVPQGRALYGVVDTTASGNGDCYCKNRFSECLAADLTSIGISSAADQQNYCNYGFTASLPSSSSTTKYPFVPFGRQWIGYPPSSDSVSLLFLDLASTGYDPVAYQTVLDHKPLAVSDGEDPLNDTGGLTSMFDMFFGFFGSSDKTYALTQGYDVMKKNDITPTSDKAGYRCKGSFSTNDCDTFSSFSNPSVLLSDSTYIGYQGTCVADTSALSSSRCLAYDDSGTTRYQSCLDIENQNTGQMNFFERMMAFFFGPITDYRTSYEALDCEVKEMRYVGWLFWGGWQEI